MIWFDLVDEVYDFLYRLSFCLYIIIKNIIIIIMFYKFKCWVWLVVCLICWGVWVWYVFKNKCGKCFVNIFNVMKDFVFVKC